MAFSNVLSAPGLSGGAPSGDLSAATYRDALGALAVEMWNSQLGVATVAGNADTWTGQWGGRVLQAPAVGQRPAYGADGAFGGGKSGVQCVTIATRFLKGVGMPTLAAAGTRPYTLSRVRMRDLGVSGNFNTTLDMGATGTDNFLVYLNSGGAGTPLSFNMGLAIPGPNVDTVVHTVECWGDGTNGNIAVDGVLFSLAFAGTLGASATSFSIGAAASAEAVTCANNTHWLHIVASAYPGAAVAAQLRAMAAAEFPA